MCLLLGAGAAASCGLPDVAGLQTAVLNGLEADKAVLLKPLLAGGNVEEALSRLRRIAALLAGSDETVDGLSAKVATDLDAAVCREVIAQLDLSDADLAPMLHLASWAGRESYHLPIELFTVNYDLLIETALEKLAVAYFDGFTGSLNARFRTDVVETEPGDPSGWLPSFLVRLWKLHGSVNWAWDSDGTPDVMRLGGPVQEGKVAAIYPSDTKYDESRRVPFVVLQDRLRRALYTPETLVLVSGYSWRDEHLNELLLEAARRRPRSEIITFSRTTIPAVVAEHAATLPNLQAVTFKEAILAGSRADWDAPAEPLPAVWKEEHFAIGDFRHLASFLALSSTAQPDMDGRLKKLLETLQGDG